MDWEKARSRVKNIQIKASECIILSRGSSSSAIPYFLLTICYDDFISYKPHKTYYDGYLVKCHGFAPSGSNVIALYKPVRDWEKEGHDDPYTMISYCS